MKEVRNVVTHVMNLSASPDRVFPLLCPVREYDWIEDWKCRLVWSKSGVAELDCVFETNLGGESELWTTVVYEPPQRIHYLVVGRETVRRLALELKTSGTGTQLTWTDTDTARTEQGTILMQERLERLKPELAMLERMLEHYLVHGKMLPRCELNGQDPKNR